MRHLLYSSLILLCFVLASPAEASLRVTGSSRTFRVANSPVNVLTNGLVGYWTFDGKDMPSGQVNDVSGNGLNASMINMSTSTAYVPGKIGQALEYYQPESRYVKNSSLSTTLSAATFSCWIYMKNPFAGAGVIGSRNSIYSGIAFRTDATSNIRILWRDSVLMNPATAIPLNKWTMVTATVDSTTGSVYFNGEYQTGSTGSYSSFTTSGALIGYDGFSTRFFNGKIDDCRIYNRALTATEVALLYNTSSSLHVASSPKTVLTNGLLGYWTFDGNDMPSGQVNDVSGNGNNGSLLNAATSSVYTIGKVGQGLNFDGVNDEINYGNISSTLFASDFTLALWVKPAAVATSYIMGKFTSTTATTDILTRSGNNNFEFRIDQNTGNDIATTNGTLVAGKWTHLVVTRIGTDLRMYLNGVNDGAVTNSEDGSTTGNLVLGDRYVAAGLPFKGNVDDFRVYERGLTAAEVQLLYNVTR